MKQNRIDNPPSNMGIKGRMRRLAVIAGRRWLVLRDTDTDAAGRKWRLHPTKGWRRA